MFPFLIKMSNVVLIIYSVWKLRNKWNNLEMKLFSVTKGNFWDWTEPLNVFSQIFRVIKADHWNVELLEFILKV